MTPSNMISVIVATCFVVFIGLGNTSLLYYAAKVRDSVQAKAEDWKVQLSASVGKPGLGSRSKLRVAQQESRRTSPEGIASPISCLRAPFQSIATVTWKYGVHIELSRTRFDSSQHAIAPDGQPTGSYPETIDPYRDCPEAEVRG